MLFKFWRSLASESETLITFCFLRFGTLFVVGLQWPNAEPPFVPRLLALISSFGCLWWPNWKFKVNSPNLDCGRISGIHSMLNGTKPLESFSFAPNQHLLQLATHDIFKASHLPTFKNVRSSKGFIVGRPEQSAFPVSTGFGTYKSKVPSWFSTKLLVNSRGT